MLFCKFDQPNVDASVQKANGGEANPRVRVWFMGISSFYIVPCSSVFSQPREKCRNFRPKVWAV